MFYISNINFGKDYCITDTSDNITEVYTYEQILAMVLQGVSIAGVEHIRRYIPQKNQVEKGLIWEDVLTINVVRPENLKYWYTGIVSRTSVGNTAIIAGVRQPYIEDNNISRNVVYGHSVLHFQELRLNNCPILNDIKAIAIKHCGDYCCVRSLHMPFMDVAIDRVDTNSLDFVPLDGHEYSMKVKRQPEIPISQGILYIANNLVNFTPEQKNYLKYIYKITSVTVLSDDITAKTDLYFLCMNRVSITGYKKPDNYILKSMENKSVNLIYWFYSTYSSNIVPLTITELCDALKRGKSFRFLGTVALGSINGVAISADGKYLTSNGLDGTRTVDIELVDSIYGTTAMSGACFSANTIKMQAVSRFTGKESAKYTDTNVLISLPIDVNGVLKVPDNISKLNLLTLNNNNNITDKDVTIIIPKTVTSVYESVAEITNYASVENYVKPQVKSVTLELYCKPSLYSAIIQLVYSRFRGVYTHFTGGVYGLYLGLNKNNCENALKALLLYNRNFTYGSYAYISSYISSEDVCASLYRAITCRYQDALWFMINDFADTITSFGEALLPYDTFYSMIEAYINSKTVPFSLLKKYAGGNEYFYNDFPTIDLDDEERFRSAMSLIYTHFKADPGVTKMHTSVLKYSNASKIVIYYAYLAQFLKATKGYWVRYTNKTKVQEFEALVNEIEHCLINIVKHCRLEYNAYEVVCFMLGSSHTTVEVFDNMDSIAKFYSDYYNRYIHPNIALVADVIISKNRERCRFFVDVVNKRGLHESFKF